MQYLVQFRMTSNFNSEYLRNGWKYSKSGRNHTHPNQFFWETIFWPLGGAALPNFYLR